jgi:hypothetical protein
VPQKPSHEPRPSEIVMDEFAEERIPLGIGFIEPQALFDL